MCLKQNASLYHARIGLDHEAESEEGWQAKLWMGNSYFPFLIFHLVIFVLSAVKWKYVCASSSLYKDSALVITRKQVSPLPVKQHSKFLILLIYSLWMIFSCHPEFLKGPTWLVKREDVLVRQLCSFQKKASLALILKISSRDDVRIQF